MASAFSGHLLSYHANPGRDSSIMTSGSMPFNPTMHGTMPSFTFSGTQLPFIPTPFANESMSEETAMRIATLQVKLDQKLGPEYVSQRPGPRGGQKLTYAEGWKIINLANEVFGFNGWSSNVMSMTTDFTDRTESGRYNVGVTAVVRVTLREGVHHEDVGYGMIENSPSKGQALDKCKKEAVTDGLKRALRNFGNLMGNCLYDKAYTQEVVKMKVPPAKFDRSELHRRPEFAEEVRSSIKLTSTLKPLILPFSPDASTSPSTSVLGSSSTPQSVPVDRKDAISNRRPSMNTRSSINNDISPVSTTAVQSAARAPSENIRHPQHPQPQQQQQVQNRSVSFAETSRQGSGATTTASAERDQVDIAKVKSEEGFDFGDDDEFLAALGVVEGDLGRPIETEADLDQPIDHEESFIPSDGDTRVGSVSINDTSVKVPKNKVPQSDKATRVERLQWEILNADPARNTNPLFTSPPLQESTPTDRVQNTSSSSSSNDQRQTASRQPQVISRQNQHTTEQQQRHQSLNRPLSIQNQIEASSTGPPSVGEPGGKRPPVPSVGGFHFPPGVNPLQAHNTNGQQGQTAGSSTGIKRPADVMSNSGSSVAGGSGHRTSRPGMGLQQAAPPRREPFAEVGQGGDVKRLKR